MSKEVSLYWIQQLHFICKINLYSCLYETILINVVTLVVSYQGNFPQTEYLLYIVILFKEKAMNGQLSKQEIDHLKNIYTYTLYSIYKYIYIYVHICSKSIRSLIGLTFPWHLNMCCKKWKCYFICRSCYFFSIW